MARFDAEFHECLEIVLGMSVPVPEYEAARFYRQWLAERNLGLVPIASPSQFDWPGHWLARVGTSDGDHAVVMFGSPSGPLHDPGGALASGGTIEEGWLLARLDVQLPIEEPYGRSRGAGVVAGILTAPDAERPLARVETVDAVAGRGLEGDRYHEGRGTFTGTGRGYELTLVEAEVLESVDLTWEQARRNIVTREIDLNALVGRRFTVGAVECIGGGWPSPARTSRSSRGPGCSVRSSIEPASGPTSCGAARSPSVTRSLRPTDAAAAGAQAGFERVDAVLQALASRRRR